LLNKNIILFTQLYTYIVYLKYKHFQFQYTLQGLYRRYINTSNGPLRYKNKNRSTSHTQLLFIQTLLQLIQTYALNITQKFFLIILLATN